MRSVTKAIKRFGMLLLVLSLFPFSADASSQTTLVQDNSAFALELYQTLRTTKDNIFLSPYYIVKGLGFLRAKESKNAKRTCSGNRIYGLRGGAFNPPAVGFRILRSCPRKIHSKNRSLAMGLPPTTGNRTGRCL